MPDGSNDMIRELSRFFAPAYVREEVEKLRGWQDQLALDTSFGRVISSPTWINGVSIQNNTVDAEKLNVGELKAITAYTGSLVVAGAQGQASGGQLTIAANPSTPGVSSIILRATDSGPYLAGIELRNSAGSVTTRLKLDGSGQLGSGPTAITWDTSGVVSMPAGAIAGQISIQQVGDGKVGGTYEMYENSPGATPKILLHPQKGIGAFAAGAIPDPTWSNAKFHLRTNGTAKFTGGIEIVHAVGQSKLTIDAATGIKLEETTSGTSLFELTSAGTLKIRKAYVGDGTSGARLELNTSGIQGFTASNNATFSLNTDGSGFIKAGQSNTYGIQWNDTQLTINASAANIQSLTVDKVLGGNFGGTYEPTSDNRLVWSKMSNGTPLSYISPDNLWVETTSRTARFASTVRNSSGTITDAAAIDIYQDIYTGPPIQYWGYIRLKYGSAFNGGPLISFQYVPSSGHTSIRLQAGGKYVDVTDTETFVSGPLRANQYAWISGTLHARSFVDIVWPDSNGTSKLTVTNSNSTTILALASDGTLFYRGSTTTAGTGAYKGAILATVRINNSDTLVKIPCYA